MQQIQPAAFRDFVNNTLLSERMTPTIPLPTASTPLPGASIELLTPANRGQIVPTTSDADNPRLDVWDDMTASTSTASAYDGCVSVDPRTGMHMAMIRETHVHRAQWSGPTERDNSWHQHGGGRGKGKGKPSYPASSSSARRPRPIEDRTWSGDNNRWQHR